MRFFTIIFLILFSEISFGRTHKNQPKGKNPKSSITKKSTAYSICSRDLIPEKNLVIRNTEVTQTIIVAMETLRNSACLKLAKDKAEQYSMAGWKCFGRNDEDLFSCESGRALSFATFNNKKLDHLTFTNLQQHRSMVAYISQSSKELCREDKAELVLAGVKDATCHFSKH